VTATEKFQSLYFEYKNNVSDSTERLAYKIHEGAGPVLIWCGGLRSDMLGSKAECLHDWAQDSGQSYIRFDYFGHGESSGEFEQGHIGMWRDDIIRVMDHMAPDQDIILCGSSMGGWASILAALERRGRVKALLLIAPAPDFTQKLMWPNFSPDIQDQIIKDGVYYEPSPYGEPMPVSKTLIEKSADYQILDQPITLDIPIRILQGMKDEPVPWQHPFRFIKAVTSEDVEITLVKSGDHSLSQPHDLRRLVKTAKELVASVTRQSDTSHT